MRSLTSAIRHLAQIRQLRKSTENGGADWMTGHCCGAPRWSQRTLLRNEENILNSPDVTDKFIRRLPANPSTNSAFSWMTVIKITFTFTNPLEPSLDKARTWKKMRNFGVVWSLFAVRPAARNLKAQVIVSLEATHLGFLLFHRSFGKISLFVSWSRGPTLTAAMVKLIGRLMVQKFVWDHKDNIHCC